MSGGRPLTTVDAVDLLLDLIYGACGLYLIGWAIYVAYTEPTQPPSPPADPRRPEGWGD